MHSHSFALVEVVGSSGVGPLENIKADVICNVADVSITGLRCQI